MKVWELIEKLEKCDPMWDVCYTSNMDPDDSIVDIEEVNEDSELKTYVLF